MNVELATGEAGIVVENFEETEGESDFDIALEVEAVEVVVDVLITAGSKAGVEPIVEMAVPSTTVTES